MDSSCVNTPGLPQTPSQTTGATLTLATTHRRAACLGPLPISLVKITVLPQSEKDTELLEVEI